jgi:hypothetical protein
MRYIPTPDETVDRFKKQAKKLQRSGAGKHSGLLNRVAKQAGYDPWHHVVKCNENAKAAAQVRSVRGECELIVAAELRGQAKAVVTKDGPACPPFVTFSTGTGDAWLLESNERLAMCLVWQSKRRPMTLRDEPDRICRREPALAPRRQSHPTLCRKVRAQATGSAKSGSKSISATCSLQGSNTCSTLVSTNALLQVCTPFCGKCSAVWLRLQ